MGLQMQRSAIDMDRDLVPKGCHVNLAIGSARMATSNVKPHAIGSDHQDGHM